MARGPKGFDSCDANGLDVGDQRFVVQFHHLARAFAFLDDSLPLFHVVLNAFRKKREFAMADENRCDGRHYLAAVSAGGFFKPHVF